MKNDIELDLIAILESTFRELDDKARIRILRWAIDWHQCKTEVRNTSALQLIGAAVTKLDAVTQRRVLDATAVLLGIGPKPNPPAAKQAWRPWTPPAVRIRALRRRPTHCSLCGSADHTRRRCDKFPTTSALLAGVKP